jgi:hypothetical protein
MLAAEQSLCHSISHGVDKMLGDNYLSKSLILISTQLESPAKSWNLAGRCLEAPRKLTPRSLRGFKAQVFAVLRRKVGVAESLADAVKMFCRWDITSINNLKS